ncbi:MAG: hypothetical protein AAGF07_01995 [Patescibacteria group bacterium]
MKFFKKIGLVVAAAATLLTANAVLSPKEVRAQNQELRQEQIQQNQNQQVQGRCKENESRSTVITTEGRYRLCIPKSDLSTLSTGQVKKPDIPIQVGRFFPPATKELRYSLDYTTGSNKMPGMMGNITNQSFDLTTAAVSTKISTGVAVGAMISNGDISPSNPMQIGKDITEVTVAGAIALNKRTVVNLKYVSGDSHNSISFGIRGSL